MTAAPRWSSPSASAKRSNATTGSSRIRAWRRSPCAWTSAIVCLMLSDVAERRPIAHELANELLERADKLMYEAKNERTSQISPLSVRIQGGRLVELALGEHPT